MDGEGGVSQGIDLMNEAVENVCVLEHVDDGPVPPIAPGDFTVLLGAFMTGETQRGLEEETAAPGSPKQVRGDVESFHSVRINED